MKTENSADVCGAHLGCLLARLHLWGYKLFIVEAFEGQVGRFPTCEFCRAPTDWIVIAEK